GLVGAVGTDLENVTRAIQNALRMVNYSAKVVRISQLLTEVPNAPWAKDLPQRPEDKRIQLHMDAGDELRRTLARTDALALLAIGAIRDMRGEETKPAS